MITKIPNKISWLIKIFTFIHAGLFVCNDLFAASSLNLEAESTLKTIISSAKEASNSNASQKLLKELSISSPMTGINFNPVDLNKKAMIAANENEAYQTIKNSYSEKTVTYLKNFADVNKPDSFNLCMNHMAENLKGKKYYSCDRLKSDTFYKPCQGDQTCNNDNSIEGNEIFSNAATNNFNRAVTYMGIVSQMQTTVSSDPLMVFKGMPAGCIRSKLGALGKNCCATNLMKPRAGLTNSCDEREVKLAAARRASRTHKIGQYCAAKSLFGCIKTKEVFCEFPTAFSRIIQEQGRQQINDLASGMKSNNDQSAIIQQIAWSFSREIAQWQTSEVNGITVAVWSWPEMSPEKIPVTIELLQPLIVASGGSNHIEGLSISLDCKSSLCNFQLTANGETREFSFTPACEQGQPAKWQIGDTVVEQDVCVLPHTQPKHWPKLTWRDNMPSFWQFKVKSVSLQMAAPGEFKWLLNSSRMISGKGNCTKAGCNYQLNEQSIDGQHSAILAFPLNCTDSAKYSTRLADIKISPVCLRKEIVFAVCSRGNNCSELPPDPGKANEQDMTDEWQLFYLPPLQNTWITLTESLFVLGSCLNNNCIWQVRSLGTQGIAGTVADNLRWNIFNPATASSDHYLSAYSEDTLQTKFGMLVKPYRYAINDRPHAQLIQYQLPSGAWQKTELPLVISKNNPLAINSSPKITVWGNCALETGECSYQFTGEITVTAMPWGDAKHPHCQGFTPQQLLLINWSQIDFKDYLYTAQTNLPVNIQKNMQITGENDSSTFYHAIHEGAPITVSAPNSQGNISMRITPLEGQGPFVVTVQLTSNWPQYFYKQPANNDPVEKVRIDWGDGIVTLLDRSQLVMVNNIPIYNAQHRYDSPPGKNILEHVTVTFYTKTAVHEASAAIENYWETPDSNPATGSGGYADQHTIKVNNMPGYGAYNAKELHSLPK